MFPAGEELPIRIEFIGDTVESIRRFDPGTQRSVETLDRFGIVPVREGVSGTDTVTRRICFSSCVPAMRRCGCPSRPMWKATSRPPGSRSGPPTPMRVERTERPARAAAADGACSSPKMKSPPSSRAPLLSRSSRSGIRDQGSGIRASSAVSVQPTASFPWTHSRLDQRRQGRAGERRSRRLRRRLARPRRAHRRTAEGLRRPRRDGVGRRRRGPRRRDGRRRLAVEGISSAAIERAVKPRAPSRQPSRSTPKPMSSTKSGARPAPARSDRRPPPSSPTCATSRSTI